MYDQSFLETKSCQYVGMLNEVRKFELRIKHSNSDWFPTLQYSFANGILSNAAVCLWSRRSHLVQSLDRPGSLFPQSAWKLLCTWVESLQPRTTKPPLYTIKQKPSASPRSRATRDSIRVRGEDPNFYSVRRRGLHLRLTTCVSRLTLLRFLPTFEDAQNTVRWLLASHFSQVIYLGDYDGIQSVTSLVAWITG